MIKADKCYSIESNTNDLCMLVFKSLEIIDFSDEDVYSLFSMIGKFQNVSVDFSASKKINMFGFFFINRFFGLCKKSAISIKIKNPNSLDSVFMQTGIDKKYFLGNL